MSRAVVIVGSLNADLVVGLERMPDPGETVMGTSFERHPGGKGLNQAVAAARLGARVFMIGSVGSDDTGSWLRSVAVAEGIDASHITAAEGASGTALIEVDATGMNRIVVVSGANATVTAEQVEAALRAIDDIAVVMCQGETPPDSIEAAMRVGKELGATTILNPAPVREFSTATLAHVDVIVPNEHEAAELSGHSTTQTADADEVARWFNQQGIHTAVITRGSHGSVWHSAAHGSGSMGVFHVDAIDTVAAGDAFCGGLATGLAEGKSLPEALRLASASGALATTKAGAVPSLPTREAVEQLIAEHG